MIRHRQGCGTNRTQSQARSCISDSRRETGRYLICVGTREGIKAAVRRGSPATSSPRSKHGHAAAHAHVGHAHTAHATMRHPTHAHAHVRNTAHAHAHAATTHLLMVRVHAHAHRRLAHGEHQGCAWQTHFTPGHTRCVQLRLLFLLFLFLFLVEFRLQRVNFRCVCLGNLDNVRHSIVHDVIPPSKLQNHVRPHKLVTRKQCSREALLRLRIHEKPQELLHKLGISRSCRRLHGITIQLVFLGKFHRLRIPFVVFVQSRCHSSHLQQFMLFQVRGELHLIVVFVR
mmetsp:Transcript_5533/g.12292  ORF Transcript_5533/g.12292 Transcript_5533/m.12292 type:complete len:286 (-) Transcript_5533:3538-4395(-)